MKIIEKNNIHILLKLLLLLFIFFIPIVRKKKFIVSSGKLFLNNVILKDKFIYDKNKKIMYN